MHPIPGNKLRIVLFEGTLQETTHAISEWLDIYGADFDVVNVEYNYQAPEFDGRIEVQEGHHGILLGLYVLTDDERRRRS